MNGGKDVKIGHDKRPVSVVPADQKPLYNIANGEILTDEFGNPLILKLISFFLQMLQQKGLRQLYFHHKLKSLKLED